MTWLHTKKTVKPLDFSYYFFSVLLIALAGLGDAVYLAVSHYRVHTDISYQSFCAISRTLNCDTVAQSSNAILMGVPVSVWGIWGYGLFLVLLSFAWSKKASAKRIWTLLLILSLCFTVYSLFLAFISTYSIKSYCIMCILSYAVNLMLVYFSWLIRNRFQCDTIIKAVHLDIRYLSAYSKRAAGILAIFGISAALMILFFPAYWQASPPAISTGISTGLTPDGYPWIGAENPDLVIEEFSDYLCFQCKKMHFFLRWMVQAYPDKIRLVHRHFPMDHTVNPIVKEPFHMGSARLALFALFFTGKEKFWEINDILFDISRKTESVNIRDIAGQAGITLEDIKPIFQDPRLWTKLQQDIQTGIAYHLTGTPGFVIDGKLYIGQIPAEVFHNHGIMKTKR